MKTRTKFVIAAISAIMLYTAAAFMLSWHDHTVPPELTVAYFAAWTTELGLLYGIKIKDKE